MVYQKIVVVLTGITFLLQGTSISAPVDTSEENVTDEKSEALEWQPLDELQQAASTGDPIAITKLADYYFWGPGEDSKLAISWYEKAAKKGNAHAQFSMGFALYAGFGVPWDAKKAAKYFRKAADQGHPIAQSELSLLYFGGVGVRKSQKESYEWARKSAEQGWPVGQRRLGQALWHGRGVSENKREACMWFIISGISEENEDMSNCSTEFGPEGLASIRTDADEWLTMHPEAARHEYDCWISQNWLD